MTASSSTGFAVGDLVLLHQTQGTSNVGKWEYNYISAISGTNWTLSTPLAYAYSSTAGKAQAVRVFQYQDVTVASGGTLSAPAWDGSKGGVLVFVASGTVSIAGQVTMLGKGYRRGDRGEYTDPIKSFGWQGESTSAGSLQSRSNRIGGGGGGQGDDDICCESCKCMGAGGGECGIRQPGQRARTGDEPAYGGLAGVAYGVVDLRIAANLGSGGGGGGADGDNNLSPGGYGGTGGGLIIVSGRNVAVTGTIVSGGANGSSGAVTVGQVGRRR